MKVYIYNAGCGDAFRIEFQGTSGKKRNILIDGGLQRTFRSILAAELKAIESKQEWIDLCIVTHIHEDHIGGIETLVNAILAGRAYDVVLQWWFNPPRITNLQPRIQRVSSKAQSIGQADVLTSYLQSIKALPKSPIMSSINPHDVDGMKIYILSPDQNSLNRLTDKYADPKIAMERMEDERSSRAVAAKERDYHKTVDDFIYNEGTEDRSIENGSSIALLTDYKGKKILWLADACPSIVVASLEALGYSQKNPLICDYVKIAHHGSLGNNSSGLYEMIKCSRYILSTDGYNIHGLPSKACLVQILKNPYRNKTDHYTFYLSSKDPILDTIFASDGEEVFGKLNFELVYPLGGSALSIEF